MSAADWHQTRGHVARAARGVPLLVSPGRSEHPRAPIPSRAGSISAALGRFLLETRPAALVVAGLLFGWDAFAHGDHFSADEIAWMERQRAVDPAIKCCNERDVHIGVRVRWRVAADGYEVEIAGRWHAVPASRMMRHRADDPSPFGSAAILFYSRFGDSLHIWCFSPEPLT
jgi:hypothetical protein